MRMHLRLTIYTGSFQRSLDNLHFFLSKGVLKCNLLFRNCLCGILVTLNAVALFHFCK